MRLPWQPSWKESTEHRMPHLLINNKINLEKDKVPVLQVTILQNITFNQSLTSLIEHL